MSHPWHYAVVVGIDQYPELDGGKRNLTCPLADAIEVAGWLGDPSGGELPAEQVHLITREFPKTDTRHPPVPLQEEIYRAILTVVRAFDAAKAKLGSAAEKKEAWEQSRFYFYISGHGIDASGDDTVVIAANSSHDYLGMHISTRGLLNALRKHSVFAEIVVIADACREFAYSAISPPPFVMDQYAGFNSALGSKVFYASASRTRKKAYEPPAEAGLTHSFFTHSLLQGLRGGVVGGEVTSEKLSDFLYNDVPALTKRYLNVSQNPEISCDPGIVFVRGAQRTHEVVASTARAQRFAAVAALDAIVYADGGVQERFGFVVDADATTHRVRVPGGSYLIVPQGADPRQADVPYHPITVLSLPVHVDLP
jgi:uncharacterized caspase-like protein